jgi:hypothetical protein
MKELRPFTCDARFRESASRWLGPEAHSVAEELRVIRGRFEDVNARRLVAVYRWSGS